jgi:hypothetical protein
MSKKSATKNCEQKNNKDCEEEKFTLSAGDLKEIEKYIIECEKMAKKALEEASACREIINKIKSKDCVEEKTKKSSKQEEKKKENVKDEKTKKSSEKEKINVNKLSKKDCLEELEKFNIKEKDIKFEGKTRLIADIRKALEKALEKEKKRNEKKKSSKSSDESTEKKDKKKKIKSSKSSDESTEKKEKKKKKLKSSKSSDESTEKKDKKKEKLKSSKSCDEKSTEKKKKSSKSGEDNKETENVTEEDVKKAADAFAKQGYCLGEGGLIYPLVRDSEKNLAAVAILRDGKPSPFTNKDKIFLIEKKIKYELKTQKELDMLLVPLIKVTKDEKSTMTVSGTEEEKTFADESEQGKESPEDADFDSHLNTKDKSLKSSLSSSKVDDSEDSVTEKSGKKKKQLKGKGNK